jgi:hypothetical protein
MCISTLLLPLIARKYSVQDAQAPYTSSRIVSLEQSWRMLEVAVLACATLLYFKHALCLQALLVLH